MCGGTLRKIGKVAAGGLLLGAPGAALTGASSLVGGKKKKKDKRPEYRSQIGPQPVATSAKGYRIGGPRSLLE